MKSYNVDVGKFIRDAIAQKIKREYRAKNKEKIKAINAKWWSENKDFIKLKTMVKKQETKPFKDMKELTEIDLKNLNKSLKKSL